MVTNWLLERYREMREGAVVSAVADGDHHVRIERKTGRPLRIGVVAAARVSADMIARLFEGDVDFVVSVKAATIFEGDAIELCASKGAAWGGLKDSFRAIHREEPSDYLVRELEFVLDYLEQHDAVASTRLLDSKRIEITRNGVLSTLIVYVDETYQVSAEAVQFSLRQGKAFDIFLASNPNAGPTDLAIERARQAGKEILRWRPLLGRLNQ